MVTGHGFMALSLGNHHTEDWFSDGAIVTDSGLFCGETEKRWLRKRSGFISGLLGYSLTIRGCGRL
jgi:hypothetical protein